MIFVRVLIQKNQFHLEISIVTYYTNNSILCLVGAPKLLLSNEKPDELLNARRKHKNMDQWHETNTKERTRKLKAKRSDEHEQNKTKSKKMEQQHKKKTGRERNKITLTHICIIAQ